MVGCGPLRLAAVTSYLLVSNGSTNLPSSGTRLGESGCDAWTLARIAGHSDIRISTRYVHPSEDAVFGAMSRLGGHKIGHSADKQQFPAAQQEQVTH
jgi:hypothetical protein